MINYILFVRAFIFTLGFHEDFILRKLRKRGALPDEPIVVFTAEPINSGVYNAYSSLRAYCAHMGLSEPRLVTLNLRDIASSLIKARHVINNLPKPIIVDIAGGFRSLGILVFIALLVSTDDFELDVSIETGGEEALHIPRKIIKALRKISPEKTKILREIYRSPGIRIEDLSRRMERSIKTIRNHISELKAMGLVTVRGRGGPLQLTNWGKVLVSENIPEDKGE